MWPARKKYFIIRSRATCFKCMLPSLSAHSNWWTRSVGAGNYLPSDDQLDGGKLYPNTAQSVRKSLAQLIGIASPVLLTLHEMLA